MKKLAGYAGLALSLATHHTLAADVLLIAVIDDAPLPGVAVLLDEHDVGVTDPRGTTTTGIESGSHTVTVIRDNTRTPIAFTSAPGENVEIHVAFTTSGDAQPTVNVRKFPDTATVEVATTDAAGTQAEEVYVLGKYTPSESSESIERYSTSITSAIDAAQLQRFDDSDVGTALNRVSGVAVVDRKYATVRGLDGRYIAAQLNGLQMPSTDSQRREVELDLFPTVIVDGIEIQKSFTAALPASTTGGSILINTKGLPDERVLEISGSLGYNPGTTGDNILSYASSNGDWAGYDSGLRKLPGNILSATNGGRSLTICDPRIDPVRCTSPAAAAQLGVEFQDDYNVGDKTALPNAEVSVAYGDRLPAGDNEWGYYLAADVDRTTADRGNAQLSNPLAIEGNYQRSQETTAATAYAAVGYEYGEADEVTSKTLYLRNTDDITRIESGINQQEDNQVDSYLLDWVERQFISQAFIGHNEREYNNLVHEFDWRAAYSQTQRDEPDRRAYTYFNNQLSSSAFERRWSNLDEHSTDVGGDYSVSLDWGESNSTELQIGGMWSDKERNFDQYRFGIGFTAFGSDIDLNIDQDLETEVLPYNNFAIGKVELKANTTDTDSYESQEQLQAGYLNTVTEFGERWTAELGARFEKFDQKLTYPNAPRANNDLTYDDWYPALNLTWHINEEAQLRFGYSETVSYPGIIERSEAQTFDPDTDDPIFGNPDLQVSTIDNFDLRAEYYFSASESVSLALFYKNIDQPVERAIPDASGSAANGTTFLNQESADLQGVELDGSKNIRETDDYLAFVAGNLSYIDSKVNLSADSLRLEGIAADGRELQGQSQWLSNLQFGVDHYPGNQKFTLLLNYFDKRIFRVSRGANNGPEYEDARVIVDFTYEKEWSEHLVINAAIKNILNTKVEYSQNSNTIESYNLGTFFKAGVTYRF